MRSNTPRFSVAALRVRFQYVLATRARYATSDCGVFGSSQRIPPCVAYRSRFSVRRSALLSAPVRISLRSMLHMKTRPGGSLAHSAFVGFVGTLFGQCLRICTRTRIAQSGRQARRRIRRSRSFMSTCSLSFLRRGHGMASSTRAASLVEPFRLSCPSRTTLSGSSTRRSRSPHGVAVATLLTMRSICRSSLRNGRLSFRRLH